MNSILLRSPARGVARLLLLASVFLLLRGHNEPGGGFAGGLLAAGAFALLAAAEGTRSARALQRLTPAALVGIGLLLALGSGLVGPLLGEPFQAGMWLPFAVPGIGKVGVPLLFDVGVYFTVWGMAVQMLFPLMEHRT